MGIVFADRSDVAPEERGDAHPEVGPVVKNSARAAT
jgi:hypothetical protein